MKILIIHTAFIGDIVLTTPLIRKIKEIYPESELFYLTTPAGAQILKNNPCVDRIIKYDKKGINKGIKNFLKLAKQLRKENFDITLTPHRYLRSSILSWLTKSPERIGYTNATGSILFTKKIPYDKKKHEVERLLDFVESEMNKRYEIELYPTEKYKMKNNKKIVTLAIGSKWFTKKWPAEYFNELIEKLLSYKNIEIILVGGQEEALTDIKLAKYCQDLRGKTDLLELADILKKSDVVVTNDSSPIHIASAFNKTHIIAIFGPTTKELGFFPWSKNSEVIEIKNLKCRPCSLHGGEKCPKGHFNCMLEIKPNLVLEKIKKYLNTEK